MVVKRFENFNIENDDDEDWETSKFSFHVPFQFYRVSSTCWRMLVNVIWYLEGEIR